MSKIAQKLNSAHVRRKNGKCMSRKHSEKGKKRPVKNNQYNTPRCVDFNTRENSDKKKLITESYKEGMYVPNCRGKAIFCLRKVAAAASACRLDTRWQGNDGTKQNPELFSDIQEWLGAQCMNMRKGEQGEGR